MRRWLVEVPTPLIPCWAYLRCLGFMAGHVEARQRHCRTGAQHEPQADAPPTLTVG